MSTFSTAFFLSIFLSSFSSFLVLVFPTWGKCFLVFCMQWFKSWMLSVGAPATSTEKYPYVLADALDNFFFTLLSLFFLFSSPKQRLLYGLTCSIIPTFCLFSGFFLFIMACFGVILVLVLFSDLAVFLWCWRQCVCRGAKITVLIFIREDFAFLIGEKFNFIGVCFGIFFVLLRASFARKW